VATGTVFLFGGVVILIYVSLVWLLSLILKRADIMDIFWGLGFIITSQVYDYWLPKQSLAGNILLSLVILWGVRLSIYIGMRGWGKPEDARYFAWREENGTRWWWFSFFKVFLLQGVVMWVVSYVLLMGLVNPVLGIFTYIGIALFTLGFTFEAVADCQMWRFKRNQENKGKVLNSGFWKYTRHPNYFGEAVLWWGYGMFALSGGHWIALISPLIMHFFLVKVSGVAMLDRLLSDTKPEYRSYIESTSAFIPWPKKAANE
jgi:steroid 5-alpha reductase family enzyme